MIPVECFIFAAVTIGALIGWAGRSAIAGREVARARSASWKDCLRHYQIPPHSFVMEHGTATVRADYGTPAKPFTATSTNAQP